MSSYKLTPAQQAEWHLDRQPSLYASLAVLLFINNVAVTGRLVCHYYSHYRHERFNIRHIFVEDSLMLLSAVLVNVVIGNLLASTSYGLGLSSSRINAQDPDYPRNLSNVFKHVWITMVFTGPTFTAIKLTLLFFYRRLFIISQRWLKIAWWTNLVYVILWFFGATGFYLFQCWPVQWYYMQYYHRYDRTPPYPIEGQCNATSVVHVSIPLIFGLFSDIAILLLPIFTISQLQMSPKAKVGLCGVFSIGVLACATDLGRIVELLTDTDDKVDPSYGVVKFLILSAATEVAAVTCACLPVIVPTITRMRKQRNNPESRYSKRISKRYNNPGSNERRRSSGLAFIGESILNTTSNEDRDLEKKTNVPFSHITSPHSSDDSRYTADEEKRAANEQNMRGRIWVHQEFEVSIDERQGHPNTTSQTIGLSRFNQG